MSHIARNFEHLIGKVKGQSEKQLRAHFALYEGYVKKINEIEEKLKVADRAKANYSFGEYSELQRRKAVPYNGAYLHQLYFESLGEKEMKPTGELKAEIERDFGSLENWFNDARAGLMSSDGWLLLTRSRFGGRLRNDMIEEHHRGVLVEQDILLALDGWEHAYMIDYGTTKMDYINALMPAINWDVVAKRYQTAMGNARAAA